MKSIERKDWQEICEYLGTTDLISVDWRTLEKTEVLEAMTNIKEIPIDFYNVFITRDKEFNLSTIVGKLHNIPIALTYSHIPYTTQSTDCLLLCKKEDKKFVVKSLEKIKAANETALHWDSIILPKDIKERFKYSTVNFIFNQDLQKKFRKYNMRFKRSILLYGPPGCGKSSLISWVRSEMEKRRCPILSWEHITSSVFNSMVSTSKTLFILEDVDAIVNQRDGTIYQTKSPLFSLILNLIDGSVRFNNYLVIMTANNIKVVDKSLLRDGRTDEKFYLPYPTYEQKVEYINKLIIPIIKKKINIEIFKKFLDAEEVPFAALDNLRKKIFIYNSVEKAVETTDIKLPEHYNSAASMGFSPVTNMSSNLPQKCF